jgi:hypothetical protein
MSDEANAQVAAVLPPPEESAGVQIEAAAISESGLKETSKGGGVNGVVSSKEVATTDDATSKKGWSLFFF